MSKNFTKGSELMPEFENGYLYLIAQDYLRAYRIFSLLLKNKKSVPVLYNAALCCKYADEYQYATGLLEEAYDMALKFKMIPKTMPDKVESALNDALAAEEFKAIPMPFMEKFDDYSLDQILLLAIELCLYSKEWKKLQELAPKVRNKNNKSLKLAQLEADVNLR